MALKAGAARVLTICSLTVSSSTLRIRVFCPLGSFARVNMTVGVWWERRGFHYLFYVFVDLASFKQFIKSVAVRY